MKLHRQWLASLGNAKKVGTFVASLLIGDAFESGSGFDGFTKLLHCFASQIQWPTDDGIAGAFLIYIIQDALPK